MTTRTVVARIAAAATRVSRIGTSRLDDTRHPGPVQPPGPSRVRIVPKPTNVGPDRAACTATVAERRGKRSGPSTPEAGVTACTCGQPVLHACTSSHARWPRHGVPDCPGTHTATLDATPTRYGRWELAEPCRRGARAVQVDPAVAIRPTYRPHECRQGVAA